jgi:hypothetical protein
MTVSVCFPRFGPAYQRLSILLRHTSQPDGINIVTSSFIYDKKARISVVVTFKNLHKLINSITILIIASMFSYFVMVSAYFESKDWGIAAGLVVVFHILMFFA